VRSEGTVDPTGQRDAAGNGVHQRRRAFEEETALPRERREVGVPARDVGSEA
jgi:hypothetical protein